MPPVAALPGIVSVLLCLTAKLGAEEAGQKSFFRQRIEPILVTRCLECHGSERKGGLDLRNSKSALAGGESGAVIQPGKPDESLLIQYVADGEMPPKETLTNEQIAALENWIRAGAWFPNRKLDPYSFSSEHRAGYDWWSLQPVRRPTLPPIEHEQQVGSEIDPRTPESLSRPNVPTPKQLARTPIDRFVLAGLQAKGLTLAASADRATYIRRVTHDLTGLLPTPAEVEQFVNDNSANAFEKLADRLLASPHYGERWGRHWLDVVRFAESNGFERDRIRRNFWPYRDYVIRSINADKPYDQFVVEQLAGDALAPNNPEYRIATGFLAAGPKNDVSTVSELERMQTRQDELDEFVVATGTTFLGLTIGCARCHDHKFDPIPSADYYALTAVFSGCNHNQSAVVATSEKRRIHDNQIQELQSKIKEAKKRQRDILEAARRQFQHSQISGASSAGAASTSPREVTRSFRRPTSERLPAVSARRNEDTFPAAKAKFVRFTIIRTNRSQPCLDELEVYGPVGNANLALASTGSVASASSLLPGYKIHQVHHLNDGKHGNSHSWISNKLTGWAQVELARTAQIDRVVWGRDREGRYLDRVPLDYKIEVSLEGRKWTRVSDASRRFAPDQKSLGTKASDKEVVASLSPVQRKAYDALNREVKALEQQIKSLPPLPTTYSISDNKGKDRVPALNRGDVRAHGEMVAAGALSAIAGLSHDLTADSGPKRRLKLARWITNPENPLTARVLVNRVWHYHFGCGIVDTPSDFGFKGGRPSHPKLLDWLAADLVAHGWKIKRLHRQIVLSATYRQGSEQQPLATQVDGGNRLLWRFPPRRLEAEAIRDMILQLSGKLDSKLGGPSFESFKYRDGNVPDYQLVDAPGSETWRRSIYRYNIRTFRSPLMAAFDCPDPSVSTPDRPQTTNPLQSLALLNNPFVVQQSEFVAERVRASADDSVLAQVAAAYRLILLRQPSAAEHQRAAAFVNQYGLPGLCRILINSNEFLYVF